MFETKTDLTNSHHAAVFFSPFHKADLLRYGQGRLLEVFFKVHPERHGEQLTDYAMVLADRHFPKIDPSRIKGFGYILADGVVNQHNKFTITVDNAEVDCFAYPELFCFNPLGRYQLEYEISDRVNVEKKSVQFHAKDWFVDVKVELPPGVNPYEALGVAVGTNRDVRTIAIHTEDYNGLVKFLELEDPLPEYIRNKEMDGAVVHQFNLTYCVHDNKPLLLTYNLNLDDIPVKLFAS